MNDRLDGDRNAPEKGKDDLKKIFGIGPVLEKTLNKLGIHAYEQIARFTPQDVERVSRALEFFPGRIERDDWIGSAQKQYRAKYGKSI
jgi:predicted flap endonuclease-1-like 5' DNA nuclease